MNCYKRARLDAGYTQAELSKKIHVSQGSISQWETGATSPDCRLLILLADLYGITLDALLGRNAVPEPTYSESGGSILPLSREEKQLIREYRLLNGKGQEYIRQTMATAVTSSIYKKDADNGVLETKIG